MLIDLGKFKIDVTEKEAKELCNNLCKQVYGIDFISVAGGKRILYDAVDAVKDIIESLQRSCWDKINCI